MLWSRILRLMLSLLVTLPLGPSTLAAVQPLDFCNSMLGVTLKFDFRAGLGLRGFLGAYPAPTGELADEMIKQGAMYWGHSFALRKTIHEASVHDAQFKGLDKVSYIISDENISDLNDDSPSALVQERFARIFEKAKVIYWDDSEAMIKHQKIPPVLKVMDNKAAHRLIVPESVYFYSRDVRGPRFSQGGWTFPKIRGELTYQRMFGSKSEAIKRILYDSRKYTSRGYTVTFNTNFQESLDLARDQARVVRRNGILVKVPDGSTYKKEAVYNQILDSYRRGHAFSAETRDPQGRLLGGFLGQRYGNFVSFETLFYGMEDNADGTFQSHVDFAKIATVGAMIRLHEAGIDVVDVNMVTPVTAALKAQYVSAEQFLRDVEPLNARPEAPIDFVRPWTPDQYRRDAGGE